MKSDRKSSKSKTKKDALLLEGKVEANEAEISRAANYQPSKDSETGSAGEAKPVRKTKTVEKKNSSTRKKATAKSEDETEKIVDAFVAKPRGRKTAAKKTEAVDPVIPVKKNPAKSVKKKSPKTETVLESETPLVENIEAPKIFPQSETSGAPENSLPQKAEAIQNEKSVLTETEEDYFADKSPVFKELALPKLPDLQPENRAWLQMQSPTRIFFYWSLKTNPFETLQKVFGGRNGNYTLSVKLQNLANGTEKIYPLAPYGSAWFDVESDAKYRAEVGFFAAHRPFIRLVFSNELETPRLAPSPRFDWSPQFAVTTQRFAEVLDVSGYKQDAFEMALAGDDLEASNKATFNAFEQLTGESEFEVKASELRLVLFALASGLSLGDLRDQISSQLFAYLEKMMAENSARLSTKKILSALEENFGLGTLESEEETGEITYSVFGASSINFQKLPKNFWKRFAPNSSLRISS